MTTFTETITLEKTTCGKCAGTFALSDTFLSHARLNAGGYNCPYCQTRWGWHESEADKLRKIIEEGNRALRESRCETLRKQQQLDTKQQAREKTERALRRVNKGLCPCCNRSFQNLRRHMASKHKDQITTITKTPKTK